MSKEHNINTFTASDIERYHKGLMSPKERNALEKAALDDPLLADALEGYAQVADNMHEDLADLRKRLENRARKTLVVPVSDSKTSYSWWKVAAMIVVIIGAGLLVYQLVFNREYSELAEARNNSPATTVAKEDSIAGSIPPGGTAVISKEADSAGVGLISDDKKTDRENKNRRSKPTEVESAGIKANDDSAVNNGALEKQNEKSPVSEPEVLANKEAVTDNPVSKQDVSTRDSRRKDNAPPVAADVEYRQARSKPNAAANSIPLNQGFASEFNVFRGRVTDNNNNALPFSNITNLNDNIGTYSDARGNFVLTSPDSVLNVQIRSLGFETTNAQLLPANQENKIQLEGDKSISANVLDTVKRNINRSRDSHMILEEPEPADGWNNYDMYLANNLKIPESFKSKQRTGTVELTFNVDNNGVPYNIVVKKSLCESCDKEAIRLIKEGPKWKRKQKKGKATVTVSF